MKRALLALAIVGMMASASNAARLSMGFTGGGTEIELLPGQAASIDIMMDLIAGESMIGFFTANELAEDVFQTTVTTPVPGWVDDSTPGFFGQPGQQVSVGTPGGVSPLATPGSHTLARQGIQLGPDAEIGSTIEVTFLHSATDSVQPSGAFFVFGPAFAGVSPGFWTYGAGSPGVDAGPPFGSAARDPLLIHVVPEPASLALLALGGFALIRRR